MSWVTDIFDKTIDKLAFFEKINSYQQGLYLRAGKIIKKTVRWDGEDLEEIINGEKDEQNKEELHYIDQLKIKAENKYKGIDCKMDEYQHSPDYIRNNIFRAIRFGTRNKYISKRRYEKQEILRPGIYLFIPLIDEIFSATKQETMLNLGNINVLTNDAEPKTMMISCNVRYQIMDYLRTFLAVHDYEESLKDYTISVLSEQSRSHSLNEWKDKIFIENLQKNVLDEVRSLVTEKWGLKVYEVVITHTAPATTYMHAFESTPVKIFTGNKEES